MNNPFIPKIKELSENTENNVKKITKAFENKKGFINAPWPLEKLPDSLKGKIMRLGGTVEYRKRTIDVDGKKEEGYFPKFDSVFKTKLPKDMYKETDYKQFKYCTEKLKQKIFGAGKGLVAFSKRQLEQIKNGEPRIGGYTWHHNEKEGIMELVKTKEHQANPHRGGRSIWGGGSQNRFISGI